MLLRNQIGAEVEAMAGGTRGEEAYPSAFEVAGHGVQELVAVIHVPAAAAKKAAGKLQVHHRSEYERADKTLEIGWSAPVGADEAVATVLCGEAIDCALIDFGSVFSGATWQMPLEVVNDGCLPLQVEAVEAEGTGVSIAGPALPATLLPGERWSGRLLLRPEVAGTAAGQVVVRTDDPERPQQPLGWRAVVSG